MIPSNNHPISQMQSLHEEGLTKDKLKPSDLDIKAAIVASNSIPTLIPSNQEPLSTYIAVELDLDTSIENDNPLQNDLDFDNDSLSLSQETADKEDPESVNHSRLPEVVDTDLDFDANYTPPSETLSKDEVYLFDSFSILTHSNDNNNASDRSKDSEIPATFAKTAELYESFNNDLDLGANPVTPLKSVLQEQERLFDSAFLITSKESKIKNIHTESSAPTIFTKINTSPHSDNTKYEGLFSNKAESKFRVRINQYTARETFNIFRATINASSNATPCNNGCAVIVQNEGGLRVLATLREGENIESFINYFNQRNSHLIEEPIEFDFHILSRKEYSIFYAEYAHRLLTLISQKKEKDNSSRKPERTSHPQKKLQPLTEDLHKTDRKSDELKGSKSFIFFDLSDSDDKRTKELRHREEKSIREKNEQLLEEAQITDKIAKIESKRRTREILNHEVHQKEILSRVRQKEPPLP